MPAVIIPVEAETTGQRSTHHGDHSMSPSDKETYDKDFVRTLQNYNRLIRASTPLLPQLQILLCQSTGNCKIDVKVVTFPPIGLSSSSSPTDAALQHIRDFQELMPALSCDLDQSDSFRVVLVEDLSTASMAALGLALKLDGQVFAAHLHQAGYATPGARFCEVPLRS